jgi:polyhydroxybutyrate depolymerase
MMSGPALAAFALVLLVHAADAATLPGCQGTKAVSGSFTIPVGADTRAMLVRVPADYDGRSARPVLLAYHGLGGTAEGFAEDSHFDELWPEAIRVYPQGVFRVFPRPGFRGDGWQISAGELADRDLRFFDALLSWLAERYCIEPRAVFATGFSNGGFFSNLLGCERPHALAAIAPVAGAMECTPRKPMPAIVLHGTADRTIEFKLGVAAARQWATLDGCAEGSQEDDHGCRTRSSCTQGEVALCAFPVSHVYGRTFSQIIVDFFRHQLKTVDSARRVN